MAIIAGIFGVILIVVVASDAFEVMLLPRRVRRQLRLVRLFFRFTWGIWSGITRRLSSVNTRDNFLSLYGPLSMVLLLLLWASGLIVGFALLQWSTQSAHPRAPDFGTALYFSGSSFFTVGYGDVLPITHLSKSLAVIEAGAGLAFIAVTIGYLPVLYQLFSRREAQVIQLDARAGSPPTAQAFLSRHAEAEALDELSVFLRDWEEWCAILVESHLSYPMLSYYRSQHDNQSWLAAVTAVLDTCALLLTGFRGIRTFSARMTFAMARLAVVELCRVFQLRIREPDVDRLPHSLFEKMCDSFQDDGLAFSHLESAEEKLVAFRATYEPFLFALADHFLLLLPGWIPGTDIDNWQRSSRGRTARQLVRSTPAHPK